MKKYKSALFNPFHGFIKENPDPIFEPDIAQLLSGVDQMIVKYRLDFTEEENHVFLHWRFAHNNPAEIKTVNVITKEINNES